MIADKSHDGREKGRKLKILWVVGMSYHSGERDGGNLRYINFSRALSHNGHSVFFLVRDYDRQESLRDSVMGDLKAQGVIADWFYEDYGLPVDLQDVSARVLRPVRLNRTRKELQRRFARRLLEIIDELNIDVCMVSDRGRLFLVSELKGHVATVLDWSDCITLYLIREMRARLMMPSVRGPKGVLGGLFRGFLQEHRYTAIADKCLAVSPVDKKWLRSIGRSANIHLLYNGVKEAAQVEVAKDPKRLVFTGSMAFPPNYRSAVWFIDRVMPKLIEQDPALQFVVAGADPHPDLVRRASPNVNILGWVPDISREISVSQLYVAPMICGSGFKNKVAEAISGGTLVAGTSLSAEFLPSYVRQFLLIGDRPEALAEQILAYLKQPDRFESRLAAVREWVSNNLTWAKQAESLTCILESLVASG